MKFWELYSNFLTMHTVLDCRFCGLRVKKMWKKKEKNAANAEHEPRQLSPYLCDRPRELQKSFMSKQWGSFSYKPKWRRKKGSPFTLSNEYLKDFRVISHKSFVSTSDWHLDVIVNTQWLSGKNGHYLYKWQFYFEVHVLQQNDN